MTRLNARHAFYPAVAFVAARLCAALTVSTDFEGGSARVLLLDANTQTVRVTPAGNVERGMPTWWCLRVDGIDPAKPFVLQVVARDTNAPDDSTAKLRGLSPAWTFPARAAVSPDGKNWVQSDPGQLSGRETAYRVSAPSPTLWLAWGPPFTPADAEELVEQTARAHAFAEGFTLARSREGRTVRGLRVREGDGAASERPAVWITARQHAWECGGSWVGAGLIEWLAGDDRPARWLRQNAEIFLVPLMDVDHVATGDGGKHALPQDHNRDWSDSPHWPEVAAAQRHMLSLAGEGRLAIFLDLHNPSPGAKVQAFFIHQPPYVSEQAAKVQQAFLDLARVEFGEINLINGNPSLPEHLPVWERIATSWVIRHGNPDAVSLVVETPWNTPLSTPAGYRETGRKLGRTVAYHLGAPQ